MEIAINGFANEEFKTDTWGPWVFMIELLEGDKDTHQIGLWNDGSVMVDALNQDGYPCKSSSTYPSLEDWERLEQIVKEVIAKKKEEQ